MLRCTLRRTYDAAALLTTHPPVFKHAHKRLVFGRTCPEGSVPDGSITVTRWEASALPARAALANTDVAVVPCPYDYSGGTDSVWHVNFADPRVFAAYGSGLLAQDELQVLEHPCLGSVREALVADGVRALTVDERGPTPILVAGVERRCSLATAPDLVAGRPHGLYGNRFADATSETILSALRILDPRPRSNIIAMAAPSGSGPYWRSQLEQILITAYTGFSAAVHESRTSWPTARIEVRTGFWGCGAFGGNRVTMTLLQALAARLAGVDRLIFHAVDEPGLATAHAGLAVLDAVIEGGVPGEPLPDMIERIDDLDHEWGTPDGN